MISWAYSIRHPRRRGRRPSSSPAPPAFPAAHPRSATVLWATGFPGRPRPAVRTASPGQGSGQRYGGRPPLFIPRFIPHQTGSAPTSQRAHIGFAQDFLSTRPETTRPQFAVVQKKTGCRSTGKAMPPVFIRQPEILNSAKAGTVCAVAGRKDGFFGQPPEAT
jgi:hypothetical protein